MEAVGTGGQYGQGQADVLLSCVTLMMCGNFSVVTLAQGEMQPLVRNIDKTVSGAVRFPENIAVIFMPVNEYRRGPVNHSFEITDVFGLDLSRAVLVLVPTNI